MAQRWLHKRNNGSCILFFNGWGMDEKAIAHLQAENLDICMFYKYHSGTLSMEGFKPYENLFLVAWSLGVWAANYFLNAPTLNFKKCIAINGTEIPVSDILGIPEKIFLGTLKNWDPNNRLKFNKRITTGIELDKNITILNNRTIEDQKEELNFIYENPKRIESSNIHWDISLIGKHDMIFSPHNQQNFWKGRSEMLIEDFPHYPFQYLLSWNEIIKL